MDRYNTSHCLDMTAALAISKADRDIKKGKNTKKRLFKKLVRLTYKIGEVYEICYSGRKIEIKILELR